MLFTYVRDLVEVLTKINLKNTGNGLPARTIDNVCCVVSKMCGPLLPIFNLSVRFYQKVSEKLRGSTTFKSFISKNIAIPCLAGLSCMHLKETGSDLCQDLQTLIRHST